MLDQETTATTGTIWQDNHSGLRRHKLMTKELADTIPPLYANDGADDPDAVVARVKLFSPYNGWRWYMGTTHGGAETQDPRGLSDVPRGHPSRANQTAIADINHWTAGCGESRTSGSGGGRRKSHRVGGRDRAVLRPRRGVRDRAGLFRSHGTGGGNRVRQGPRCGAGPVLGAADPRRDQETVVGDSGLVNGSNRRGQR